MRSSMLNCSSVWYTFVEISVKHLHHYHDTRIEVFLRSKHEKSFKSIGHISESVTTFDTTRPIERPLMSVLIPSRETTTNPCYVTSITTTTKTIRLKELFQALSYHMRLFKLNYFIQPQGYEYIQVRIWVINSQGQYIHPHQWNMKL